MTVAPARELVVKFHERCNIACDHCYMYEAADQGWRARPIRMAAPTVDRAAQRLGEHARAHGLGEVRVVLHGGEPLLAGVAAMESALRSFRDALPPGVRLEVAVQTNGILLTESFLALFREHGVRVGVSLDGDRVANDRHRRYANGRSSFDEALAGVERLRRPENAAIYGGLLCTIDLANDPVGTYESLIALGPPRIDFLVPHGNWAHPPPGLADRAAPPGAERRTGTPGAERRTGTPYADWLIAVFDRWYAAPRLETEVRILDSIMALLCGGVSRTEMLGLRPPSAVVVESDGTYEGDDALKTTDSGPATGLSVHTHSLDDLLAHPAIAAGRRGLESLGPQCRACPVVTVCGGGLQAHRYSPGAPGGDFSRPSVYCEDLFALIGHVRQRLAADLLGLRR
ncbi:FxsB family cyclophane-forming radical SAM/SPASM peptide maturase [Actinoplanes rectilineatus]|uniref:FxsB family cyclophane-forming radical SAM/SPASM peptide maturase n=1 Tax=Actinoplanes rectilineatus TaxID=113571 RepID=UPI0005F2DB32|nr:FxsB family cyclophane-forming radical SAM/SPASM peptide maturase [Actinoplanes rectilineatus]